MKKKNRNPQRLECEPQKCDTFFEFADFGFAE